VTWRPLWNWSKGALIDNRWLWIDYRDAAYYCPPLSVMFDSFLFLITQNREHVIDSHFTAATIPSRPMTRHVCSLRIVLLQLRHPS
jgi:hypothetical protein